MRILISLLMLAAACGGDPGGQLEVDAPAADAGGVDAYDLDAGLPLGHLCAPLARQCLPGLTCRIQGGDDDGWCLPVGTTAEGDICTSVNQCGPGMTCLPAELGRWRCVVVCHVPAPTVHCGDEATRDCVAYWNDRTGYCRGAR